jgi:glycosyltransferase involved in cell wall biosynthesis
MRENLIRLGAEAEKIAVIPNGADVPSSVPPRPPDAPRCYLLYFGAVQRWQGVDVLLRAFAHLADMDDLHLVICVSTRPRQAKPYRRLARRMGIEDRVRWLYRLPEGDLAGWRSHALLSLAPLIECSRNLEQGCCPLKILESMASGVPVVASDLPVVRELVRDGIHGRLTRPGRPSELARDIRIVLEYPERRAGMGRAAQSHIEQHYTWAHATAKLEALYKDLGLQTDGLRNHW